MKNCILICFLITNLCVCSLVPRSKECQCNQLYMEKECQMSEDCTWDQMQKLCITQKVQQTPPQEQQLSIQPKTQAKPVFEYGASLFCNQILDASKCKTTNSCAWIEDKCNYFTACSAYQLASKNCSDISSRCKTIQNQCIELIECSNYSSQNTCDINNIGKYCIWQNSDQKCQDITQCSQLPLTLMTDSQCRFQLSWCTVNETGGCIESGENCNDQIYEKQCITNRIGDQGCLWKDNQCVDLTCQNAPTSLTTDDQCKTLLSSCTTKKDGGCAQRLQCSDAEIEEACITDIDNNKCFWDGNQCQNRNCSNAPQIVNTNDQCSEYLANCITNGNGCVENTGCESAIVQQSCDKTLTGILCHWDGTKCKEKKCENAGPLIIGQKACNEFVPNCTAKVNDVSGCMLISCLSAQLSNITNDQCEQYLPNSNCITKQGGGCKENTTCENIDLKIACIKNNQNQDCYWNDGCKLKTCENAPSIFNTNDLCQKYSNKCVLGPDSKCVNITCEIINDQESCTYDYTYTPCIFVNTCKDKQCSFAPKTITKFEDCQKYLSTCTLDNSGQGCMETPEDCNDITLIQSCKFNKQGQKCGWLDDECIDNTCYTASVENNTTQKCQSYKQGCVVNNSLNGCMDLPDECVNRKQQQNCQIANENKCQWDSTNTNCFEISCQNANLVSLNDNVTQDGCWNYYELKCIINNTNDGCVDRPEMCNGLQEDACNQEKVLVNNQNCYWDLESLSCKVYACQSITFPDYQLVDHDTCNSIMNNCTVNELRSGCVELTSCDQYTSDQCYIDNNQQQCEFIDPEGCQIKICEHAEDSSSYLTYSDCQDFSKQCTVSQLKCKIKQNSCLDYQNQFECEQNTLNWSICYWYDDIGCSDDILDCSSIQGSGLSAGYCSYFGYCSVNAAKTNCIDDGDTCDSYYTQDDCYWASSEGYCAWVNNECVVDCTQFPGPYYDLDYCQSMNYNCTVKLNGSGCVKAAASCGQNSLASCTTDADFNYCYPKKGTTKTTCKSATDLPLTTCNTVTGVRLLADYCQSISEFVCSVNSTQTSCITMKTNCSDYQPADCFLSENSTCVYLNGVCTDLIDDENVCANIKLYNVTLYTDSLCQAKSYYCIANSNKTGCISGDLPYDNTDCSSFTGTNLTFFQCVEKSSSCSVNAAKTACVNVFDYCSNYSLDDCNYATEEGECIILNGVCVQKQCDGAPITATTNANCQSYSSNCILRQGGCSTKSTCDSYKIKEACVQSLDSQDCLWNPSTAKCVIKSCENAESSINFDTAQECAAIGNCTVKAKNKSISWGCIPFAPCNTYTIQVQCNQDDKGIACIWNVNDPLNPVCSYKSCSTALLSINNHTDCQAYLNNCTVNMINSTPQGCVELQSCEKYVFEAQCIISSEKDIKNSNIICGWNGFVCADKSCLTAGKNINDPIQCSNYFQNCTVNSTNDGCVQIPNTCEEMTKSQCFVGSLDSSNRECTWQVSTCKTKTCLNYQPINNNSSCESYLPTCTTSVRKCFTNKSFNCSDLKYTTDFECSSADSSLNCTTDGSQCVDRKQCSDVQNKTGCTRDVQGIDCEWVINDDQSEECKIKSCLTAPKTLLTEEECMKYFPFSDGQICTTKRNGGCLIKGNCNSLTLESICNVDKDGNKCVWDNQLQYCRNPGCQDLQGETYIQCQSFDSKCTMGLNGKCALITICEVITSKELCLIGTNGSCIWLNDYQNSNKSLGACFSYNSCNSFKWKTDQQCKLISPLCTTNGNECVGLTTCSQTNTNGGCLSGIDGVCVQTPIKLNDSTVICKKFNGCTQVYYLTHDECYQANNSCTSDYITGCIPLTDCKLFTQEESCHINNIGILIDNEEQIVSTGNCVWENKACRDEQCSDIKLSTESECSAKLINCTSDGQSCLIKGQCSTYITEDACKFAGGIDGTCIWIPPTQTNVGTCRIKVCTEIENGTSDAICSALPNCISDGKTCINKAECSTYLTQIACQSKGTDEVCVWIESTPKCLKMQGCADAKDEATCQQANDRCYWDLEKKDCSEHTCETFSTQEQECTHFLSWDRLYNNICSNRNNTCTSSDVQNLDENQCFEGSGNLYSWNPYFKSCIRCEKVIHNEIPIDTNNNLTANELILFFAIMQLMEIFQ